MNKTCGTTRTCGVIGNPIKHTMSPVIHNGLAALTGIDLVYVPFEVDHGRLEDAVKGADALKVMGINVTVPYKSDVMKYLVDIDPLAQKIGAVNTLQSVDGGGYKGYNTDIIGFKRSLLEEGVSIAGRDIVLLGAGGVARPIAYLCAHEQAASITILNRTVSKAQDIVTEVSSAFPEVEMHAGDISLCESMPAEIADGHDHLICIQCTSIGMFPKSDAVIVSNDDFYDRLDVGFDAIYTPMETVFLSKCKAHGAKAISGLKMLLYQGVEAFEIWTGESISVEQANIVYEEMKKSLQKTTNIVLVGFMGSGKTTVARALLEKTGFDLVDMDASIEKEQSRQIKEIFETEGEQYFRDLESKCLMDLVNDQQGLRVVSTGGGCILRKANRSCLHDLGEVFYLRTSPQEVYNRLVNDESRPLLAGKHSVESISSMQVSRENFYRLACDHVIDTDGKSAEQIADEILALR